MTDGDTEQCLCFESRTERDRPIKGLAEDERVYSARFMGKAGYFVTFKETDPLFSVDPSNRKIQKS